jgi:hypothetical protein
MEKKEKRKSDFYEQEKKAVEDNILKIVWKIESNKIRDNKNNAFKYNSQI